MTLKELQDNLVCIARQRVRAGRITERSLARSCGLSQPHIHNVLKNLRTLSPTSSDRLMRALNLQITDLLWRCSGEDGLNFRIIPVLRARLGPGSEAVFTDFRSYTPVPLPLLQNLERPVCARLAPDLVMPCAFSGNDLVLLDQSENVRSAPSPAGWWVVSESGGLRVRYIRTHDARLFIANEARLEQPDEWDLIPLARRNILEIVRARIVWMGREMETETAGPLDAAG